MCCGYYQKIKDKEIDLGEFYKKRYIKIWPFFALLCLLDLVVSPSINSLYEVFANLTLCQGLLPNANISVIGVSWTLAVIFVFYMLFPFFCFLIENKKKAWVVATIALAFNYICTYYFFDKGHMLDGFSSRVNIIYDAVYFIVGGLIFLYRNELSNFSQKHRIISSIIVLLTIIMYYIIEVSTITSLIFCASMLIYAIGCKKNGILINPVTKFLGGICFEIYLSHMIIYRVVEKIHLVTLFGNGLLSYIFISILVICGTIVFSICTKWLLKKTEIMLNKMKIFIINRRINHD